MGSDDVCPIAIGEVLRTITAKAFCLEKQPDFRSSPQSNGVAMREVWQLYLLTIPKP